LLELTIRKGFNEMLVTRTANNLLDALSAVGGLLGMVQIIISLLISGYVEKAYYGSILGKLFKY